MGYSDREETLDEAEADAGYDRRVYLRRMPSMPSMPSWFPAPMSDLTIVPPGYPNGGLLFNDPVRSSARPRRQSYRRQIPGRVDR